MIIPLVLAFSCQGNKMNMGKNAEALPEVYLETMSNLTGFFDTYAYDPETGAYYSELDNSGAVLSGKIYNVAISRLVYGLSFSALYFPQNLEKAKSAVAFQLENLIGTDGTGPYFRSFTEDGISDTSTRLDIWQQAYGLCGLTELYRIAPDQELLTRIHSLHDAFVLRFRDVENGGFYGNYSLEEGQISGSKTLQSLMYPITAYMANLWLADSVNRKKYEPLILENIRIAGDKAWDQEKGWVNVRFDDSWEVCKSEDEETPCFMVAPGHNFQLASVLLRAGNWDFIPEQEREKFKNMGLEILAATLNQPIFYGSDLSEGFISEINPLTNAVTDDRKTWWQHCEALIALSLCDGKYNEELTKLEAFYFGSFPDFENGGEFFYLSKDNEPITSELKGSMGKSAYHTIEMIRFLIDQ
jgi:mannose/cellobiose epimerase-like protein (N-acyl-D-glucosamine 2-epimerase family)